MLPMSIYFEVSQDTETGAKFKPWMKGVPIPVGGKGPAPSLDLTQVNPDPVTVSTQQRMQDTLTKQQYNQNLLIQRSAKNPRVMPVQGT